MIKFTVTSKVCGEKINTHVNGDISGRHDVLVFEVAHILQEFNKLGDDILTDAFGLMLDRLLEGGEDDD